MDPVIATVLAAGCLLLLSGVAGILPKPKQGCARTRTRYLTLVSIVVLGLTLGPFIQIAVSELTHAGRMVVIQMWALFAVASLAAHMGVRWMLK